MTAPTAADLRRAICCPRGACIAPEACYALDKSRAYPVHIHDAAEAVARLLCERWRTGNWKAEDRDHAAAMQAQRADVWR